MGRIIDVSSGLAFLEQNIQEATIVVPEVNQITSSRSHCTDKCSVLYHNYKEILPVGNPNNGIADPMALILNLTHGIA